MADDISLKGAAEGSLSKDVEAEKKKAEEKIKAAGELVKSGLGSVFSSLGKLAGSFGARTVSLGIEAEQTAGAYTTMTGSAEVAKRTISGLSDFAAKTPYGKKEVMDAGKQMLTFGFEADELKAKLGSIGNVAAGVGSPLGDMANLFGKVKDQGKAMMGDLDAFAASGVPIFEELGKVLGMSGEEVRQLAEAGSVSYGAIEQAFANMGSEGGRYFNAMNAQSQTTGGQLSTMFETLDSLGESLGIAMLPIIGAFAKLATVLVEQIKPVISFINPVFKFIGDNLNIILAAITPLTAALIAYAAVQKAMAIYTTLTEIATWAFNAALYANPIGLIVAAIVGLIAMLIIAWQNFDTFRGVMMVAWEVIKAVAKAIWDWSPPFMLIRAQIQAVIALVKWLWPIIKDVFGKIKAWIAETFGAAIQSVIGKIEALFGWLLELADKMGLTEIVNKLRTAFKSGVDMGKKEEEKEEPEREEKKSNEEVAAEAAAKQTTMTQLGSQTKLTSDTTGSGLVGVQSDPQAPRSLTISIDKLIESFTVSTTTLQEGASEVKRVILETFVDAVRDFETSYK